MRPGSKLSESRRGDQSVVIVERLRVRDGLLVESTFVTDMAAFGALLGGPGGTEGGP